MDFRQPVLGLFCGRGRRQLRRAAPYRLHDLLTDGKVRVERVARILEDHREVSPAPLAHPRLVPAQPAAAVLLDAQRRPGLETREALQALEQVDRILLAGRAVPDPS